MARDGQYRLLYASISNSHRIRAIKKKHVKGDKWWRIAVHLLYSWIVPMEDDDRRLPGDPLWILTNVVRWEELTADEIEEMLAELDRVKLILWYEVNGDKFIQVIERRDMQRIRKDRYKPSIYPPPDPNLLKEYTNGCQIDNQLTTRLPSDCGESAPQSLSLSPSLSPSPSLLSLRDSVLRLIDLYNFLCPNLIPSIKLSKERERKIITRLKENPNIDWWKKVFQIANEIELPPNEKHPNGWKPDLEFMVRNEENAIKIFEGKYTQQKTHKQAGAEALLKKTIQEDLDEKTK